MGMNTKTQPMVTAENLTDEQIREEWTLALDAGDRGVAELAQVALGSWRGAHEWSSTIRSRVPACDICRREPGDSTVHIGAARARIAAAINARRETDLQCSRCGRQYTPTCCSSPPARREGSK